MKRHTITTVLIAAILILALTHSSEVAGQSNRLGPVRLAEADGSPDHLAYKLIFPNGTLSFTNGVATFTPTLTQATSITQTIGTTSADGLLLINPTPAAAGAQQWSPRLHFTGQGWKTNATAASQTVDWKAELVPVEGAANPQARLDFNYQINSGGYQATPTISLLNGNVGIGTTAPGAKLEVFDDSNGGIVQLTRDAGELRGFLKMGRHNSGSFQAVGGFDVNSSDGSPNNGIARFWTTNASGTFAPRVAFDQNGLILGPTWAVDPNAFPAPTGGAIIQGNVGIGTTTPRALLDIGTGFLVGTGLQLPHVINKAASANVRNSHDNEATSQSTVYVKVKTITLTNGLVGAARFLFDLKTSNVANTANGRIYRNGVALGTEQSDVTGAYVTKSEDITQTWNPGDTVELWVKIDLASETVSVRNFRIAYDDSATIAVAAANS